MAKSKNFSFNNLEIEILPSKKERKAQAEFMRDLKQLEEELHEIDLQHERDLQILERELLCLGLGKV